MSSAQKIHLLAATIHDPDGKQAHALEQLAPKIRAQFGSICLNISSATPSNMFALAQDALDAHIIKHTPDQSEIGKFRRDVVALALEQSPAENDQILYTDFDHLLRWIERDPADLATVLNHEPEIDLLVIGRGERAMQAEPQRLRETERWVNHTFKLMTGHNWDLLFAVRRMGP